MKKRGQKGAEHWERVIQEFLGSGISQKDFIEKHGLCRATLWDWSKRLGIALSNRRRTPKIKESAKIKKPEAPLTFLEVKPSKAFSLLSSPSAIKCELSFPQGPTLKIESGATWEQVGQLLKTLVG